jgi:hypothetical protein
LRAVPMLGQSLVNPVAVAAASVKKPSPFRHKSWDQAQGDRETSARLAALPSSLQFDDDFPEPIRYDPARRMLIYRGFMSYGSFQYLQQLHSDSDYARALDELFRCSSGVVNPPKRTRWWPVLLAAIGAALAALIWRILF